MSCDVIGLLTNAAKCLDTAGHEILEMEKRIHDQDDEFGSALISDEDEPTGDIPYYAFCLRELAQNLQKLKDGYGTFAEFAKVYGLEKP